MRKTNEPDALAMLAAEASALGISYGKLMAMKRDRAAAKTHKQHIRPSGAGICEVCGGKVPQVEKGGRTRKYCCEECAIEAKREINRIGMQKKRKCAKLT